MRSFSCILLHLLPIRNNYSMKATAAEIWLNSLKMTVWKSCTISNFITCYFIWNLINLCYLLPSLITVGSWEFSPMAGQDRAVLWGTGDWHYCSITGAGTDGPRELKWGSVSWAGWREFQGTGQGHLELKMPLGSLQSLTLCGYLWHKTYSS